MKNGAEHPATADVREVKTAEEQTLPGISGLPETLDAEQLKLAELAREKTPLDEEHFQLHVANALYLAQEELERRMGPTGGIESKLPKMSRSKAIMSLMKSECFSRFCENQGDAEGISWLFEGQDGVIKAIRQFGAAIRQVAKEKIARQFSQQPARQAGEAIPERSV